MHEDQTIATHIRHKKTVTKLSVTVRAGKRSLLMLAAAAHVALLQPLALPSAPL